MEGRTEHAMVVFDGLEDVQGVYTLDNGPLFIDGQDQDSTFLNGYSMANNQY